jgi:hypothetical protein
VIGQVQRVHAEVWGEAAGNHAQIGGGAKQAVQQYDGGRARFPSV